MANLFTVANSPEIEPEELIVGDLWQWRRTDLNTDYPNDSYTLKYALRLQASTATELEINASASGDDYLVSVASSATATYTAGDYTYQCYIIRNSDSARITIRTGTLKVVANRDASTADPRTNAKIFLDAIQAVIEGRATRDQESYSIAGRSLSRTPLEELHKFEAIYKSRVFQEEQNERMKRCQCTGGQVKVGF